MSKEFDMMYGIIKYTIVLDESNKLYAMRVGETECFKTEYLRKKISQKALKDFFKCLLLEKPEQFAELYCILKQNDAEIFAYAHELSCEMRDFFTKLTEG